MAFDLSAVTGALGALKALTGIAKDVNNIEFNQKLVEIQQKLLDIQVDFGNLLEENRTLKAEIEEGKAVDFHHSVNWRKSRDAVESGPYCPICYADKGKFMPLEMLGGHRSDPSVLLFACPVIHKLEAHGGNSSYWLPKDLIAEDRYAAQR